MATTREYVEYVCEQLRGIGELRYRKMFGEYMVYVNDKPAALVCDNTVYVKKLPEIEPQMAAAEVGIPYPGAKEHYVLDIDNGETARVVVAAVEVLTAVPKSKKR